MNDEREMIEGFLELPKLYFDCLRRCLGNDEHAHPRQGPMLCLLLRMDGMSQADLVRELDVSAATVAVSLARLERLGYVQRERNIHNQRANILRLTQKGREEAQRMQRAMHQLCRQAIAGLSEEECALMHGIGNRMIENLHRAYENAEQSQR